LGFFSMLNLGS